MFKALDCGAEGCGFKPISDHPPNNSLCSPNSELVPFGERVKAVERDDRAPPLICGRPRNYGL